MMNSAVRARATSVAPQERSARVVTASKLSQPTRRALFSTFVRGPQRSQVRSSQVRPQQQQKQQQAPQLVRSPSNIVRTYTTKSSSSPKDIIKKAERDLSIFDEIFEDPFSYFNFPSFWRPNKAMRDLLKSWPEWTESMFAPFQSQTQSQGSSVVRFRPAMDVIESSDAYKLVVEVPGIKKEDLKVEFKDDILTISGEKKQEKVEEKKDEKGELSYHRSERWYGSFSRSFRIPAEEIRTDGIQATYKDGVLSLTIPKREPEKKPSTISIKIEDEPKSEEKKESEEKKPAEEEKKNE